MAKVIKIGIASFNGNKIKEVSSVEALKNEGLVGDRHSRKNNDIAEQITLIESENIDAFNKELKTNIDYKDFRRNIITEGIKLNDLVGKTLLIGKVKIKAHDLCKPCKHLQEIVKQDYLLKKLMFRGGLRGEILSSGKIKIGDIISIIKH